MGAKTDEPAAAVEPASEQKMEAEETNGKTEEAPVASPKVEEKAVTPAQEPGLKRRQSSEDSTSAKRPRVDYSPPERSPSPTNDDAKSPSQAAPLPPRRASGAPSKEDERKRGQRLFGGLLSTLSQGGASSRSQQKRAEVEKRQRERLREQEREGEAELKKKLARVTAKRWKQQDRWDAESMRIRHDNLLAQARCLKTTARPVLYYKPWKLLDEQQRKVDAQIENAEKLINDELADAEYRRKQRQERDRKHQDSHTESEQIRGVGPTAGEGAKSHMQSDTKRPEAELDNTTEVVTATHAGDEQEEMEETNEDYVMY